jgi:hypothetical protein
MSAVGRIRETANETIGLKNHLIFVCIHTPVVFMLLLKRTKTVLFHNPIADA